MILLLIWTWITIFKRVLFWMHFHDCKTLDHFDFPARAACLSANTLSKNLQQFKCSPNGLALHKIQFHLFSLLAWSPKSLGCASPPSTPFPPPPWVCNFCGAGFHEVKNTLTPDASSADVPKSNLSPEKLNSPNDSKFNNTLKLNFIKKSLLCVIFYALVFLVQ